MVTFRQAGFTASGTFSERVVTQEPRRVATSPGLYVLLSVRQLVQRWVASAGLLTEKYCGSREFRLIDELGVIDEDVPVVAEGCRSGSHDFQTACETTRIISHAG